jgi:anhydro-N-acetylmuramic acid kinase
VDFGGWLADAAVQVLADAGVPRADVRAIGSHGQTLWHEPGHSTWQLDGLTVRTFDERFFDAEAKEAVAFALLALLHLERRPGNVPTATGARGPRVLGVLTPPTTATEARPVENRQRSTFEDRAQEG